MDLKTLTINGQEFTVCDPNAVRTVPQNWSADKKAQARRNIEAAEDTAPDTPMYERYFDIDYDGIVSLKAEYQNGGSMNAELPETIVIPDVVDGTAVSALADYMFQDNLRIKEIKIPNAVTELPERFCSGATNLIAIHNTEQVVKIGARIILKTKVKEVIFPNLKEAADGAFASAPYLYIADIGDNITDIPFGMFRQDISLSLIKGGSNVKTIGNEAFYQTRNLKNLPLLSNVTSIGKNAFFRSRIQFNWGTLNGKCDFADGATPVKDNTTDYWSSANPTPCKNRLVSMMDQKDDEWTDLTIPGFNLTYYNGCAVFAALHIHSALSGKVYTHPDEFMTDALAVYPEWVNAGGTGYFKDAPVLLQRLGYKTTVYVDYADYADEDMSTIANDKILVNQMPEITSAIYQAICDALVSGAYVYSELNSTTNPEQGHVVVIYGVNSNGEVLVLDSDGVLGHENLTYRIPLQNITGPKSNIIIVEKEE